MRSLSPELQAHFDAPRNVGRLAHPARCGLARNTACGDDLRLYAQLESGTVQRASFQARSCSAVIAVASLCVDELRGLPPGELLKFDVQARVEAAGGLPSTRRHAVGVVERALRELARELAELAVDRPE